VLSTRTVDGDQMYFGPRTPVLRKLVSSVPPPKIARENVLNRQYLSRGSFDYAYILYRV